MRQYPSRIAVLGPAIRETGEGIYFGVSAVIHGLAPNAPELTADTDNLSQRRRAAALCKAVGGLTDGNPLRLKRLSAASRLGDSDFLAELVGQGLISLLVLRKARAA
jgi:hypothetical protein